MNNIRVIVVFDDREELKKELIRDINFGVDFELPHWKKLAESGIRLLDIKTLGYDVTVASLKASQKGWEMQVVIFFGNIPNDLKDWVENKNILIAYSNDMFSYANTVLMLRGRDPVNWTGDEY